MQNINSSVYRTDNAQRLPVSRPCLFKSASSTWNDSEILYVNSPANKAKTKHNEVIKECSTQTSKTILELARLESGDMSPDSLAASPRELNYSLQNSPYTTSISQRLSEYTLDGSCQEQDCIFTNSKPEFPPNPLEKPLTQTFLEKNRFKFGPTPDVITCYKRSETFKSQSFIDSYIHPNYIQEPMIDAKMGKLTLSPSQRRHQSRMHRKSSKSIDLPDNSFQHHRSTPLCYSARSSFMWPTTASQIKSKMAEIKSANSLIPPMRRGRSTSPKPGGDRRKLEASRKIPYIDQSKSDFSSSTTIINTNRTRIDKMMSSPRSDKKTETSTLKVKSSDGGLSAVTSNLDLNTSVDTSICSAVNKFRDPDWRVALRGLGDLVELCRVVDVDQVYDYMPSINQRLIELLKSPRSHVCRTACQAAGHLFEYVKDTRRPEFDDIVDLLLHKTADANKFIRQDANLALDCMVTHISSFNAVRSLCSKGPNHKNHLVRSATVRLLVCVAVISGADSLLNPNNNEHTRRRIILNLARFLEDKNLETRKLAERLYKVLCKEPRFEVYLKKYLEKEQIARIKKTLRLIHKK